MVDQTPPTNHAMTRVFKRKIWLSKLALFFERLWPRLWVLLGLIAIFAALSLAGFWSVVPTLAHQALLAGFAVAGLASIVFAVRVPWPSRDEAVRRIERRSGVPHRPATSYEDTLSGAAGGAETAVLWQAHRERLSRAIDRLKVGSPSPRADRFDPFAVRSLALLVLVPAALLVNGSVRERLASAFEFDGGAAHANARLDAWVTPPPYTAIAPILLADGGAAPTETPAPAKLIEVPERSLMTLRGVGYGGAGLTLEVLSEGATTAEIIKPEATKVATDPSARPVVVTAGVSEVRFEIKKSAVIRALNGSRALGQWTFGVIPDQLPTIALAKELDRTPRGSLKLTYIGEDDYGIASAAAKLRQAPPKPSDPSKAWARPEPLSGPRLPLEKPPVLTLKVPKPGEKVLDGSTLLDLGAHPWAGQRVELWLEATDVGGQIGRSTPVEIVLPARRFKKPLARAVIEQRRKLAEDSRNRPRVARALDALTLEPEGLIETTGIFLGLRTAFHRIQSDGTRDALKETVDQLWELALKIEDGALSDAERALKDAQDKLAEALQKGADDQEIQDRLAELKQKLNEYLDEMQKNAAKENGEEQQAEQDQQDQGEQLGQKDLDEMMKELEKNAREGSREEAEKMLSDMKELMERLQANNSPEAKAEQKKAAEMMKKLDMLGNLAGKQQQLMDETFGEQKKQQSGEQQRGGSQDDPNGQNSPNSQQGEQGQGQQQRGQNGKPKQQGGAQQGQGKQGDKGQGVGEKQPGESDLGKRQAELREELDRLQKELEELGAGDPDKLGKAEDSMGEAEESLGQKDFENAAQQQAEALDQMRESAKSMAEQMQKNAQQKMGRGGDTPRDPLGRPQRSQGPDVGQSVKVPNAIDAQRAREILDELRKRSSESLRPAIELDYIDRLLRRF